MRDARINIAASEPLCGSSYIPIPKRLVWREAVLNVKNDAAKCFVWAELAGLHPVNFKDHPDRVSKYETILVYIRCLVHILGAHSSSVVHILG